MLTYPSPERRQANGYVVLRASGGGPGVIVIQEWRGLTIHIAHMADRLAGEGFVRWP